MTDATQMDSAPGRESRSRLHEAAVRRHARNKAFVDFHASAKTRFELLTPMVAHWPEYEDHYHAHFLPGGWDGGTDADRVDVIFGNRIVDSSQAATGKGLVFRSERGSWLSYQRQLGGQVMIFLYAARLSIESHDPQPLLLDIVPNASHLSDKRLSRHLNDLVAFMAATILDDTRTLRQRARAAWLRWIKPSVGEGADGVWGIRPPRWVSTLRVVGHWVLTIGLSGTLLYCIQRFFPAEPESAKTVLLHARIETALEDTAALRAMLRRDRDASRRLHAAIQAELAQIRSERD